MESQQAESEIARTFKPLILHASATVTFAARQMDAHNVSAVLVTGGGLTLAGIFTARDAVARVLAKGKDPRTTSLIKVMSCNPVIIGPTHTAIEVLRVMQDAHCRHLPIVDQGRIVGLVSRGDFRDRNQENLDA
jgi:CBS domain-containing protein